MNQDALIEAAERHAAAYDGDPRECIKTDVLNAFYAGAKWQAAAPAAHHDLPELRYVAPINFGTRTRSVHKQGWDAAVNAMRSALAAATAAPPSPEAAAEQFIAAEIDRAPEPLRRLGEHLSRVLDEDQFKTASRMLLGAIEAGNKSAAATAAQPVAYRYRVPTANGGSAWTFTKPQPELILETQALGVLAGPAAGATGEQPQNQEPRPGPYITKDQMIQAAIDATLVYRDGDELHHTGDEWTDHTQDFEIVVALLNKQIHQALLQGIKTGEGRYLVRKPEPHEVPPRLMTGVCEGIHSIAQRTYNRTLPSTRYLTDCRNCGGAGWSEEGGNCPACNGTGKEKPTPFKEQE